MKLPDAASASRPAAASNWTRTEHPVRRPGSLRRTSSIQTCWPGGPAAHAVMTGRARDLFTRPGATQGEARGSDWIAAEVDAGSRIVRLDGSRRTDVLSRFAGLLPGGELRKAVAAELADESEAESRLHRLLDDLAGASFMAMSAWYAWPGGLTGYHARSGTPGVLDRPVTGVCLSFVPGSPALRDDGTGHDDIAHHPVGPSASATFGALEFHELAADHGANQWRLRRTDAWLEEGALCVDAWFQDSSAIPGETAQRLIFHEYSLIARFDAATLELVEIEVTPQVLPYTTCLASVSTPEVLLGRSARTLRSDVPQLLRGSAGCTHLNDMLRSLQDVAGLSQMLTEAL